MYLSSGVPIVVLVLLAQSILLRVGVLDLLVGHLLTDTLEKTPSHLELVNTHIWSERALRIYSKFGKKRLPGPLAPAPQQP